MKVSRRTSTFNAHKLSSTKFLDASEESQPQSTKAHLVSSYHYSHLSKSMSDSPPPSYSFHGSNSSHSKDNGYGGRTYHIPNYATSYANDRSKLISIRFDEDKRAPRAIITVISIFLVFAAVSLFLVPLRFSQVVSPAMALPERSMSQARRPDLPLDIELSSRTEQDWAEPTARVACIAGEPDCPAQIDPTKQATGRFFYETRRSGNAFWDEPKANPRCSGFGAREYTSRLRNLPFFSDWTGTCKEAEIEIHGVVLSRPMQCESRWPIGGVIGHWVVDFKEDDCLATWGKFSDKGCATSGFKRFQSRLRGPKNKEDRMTVCHGAPAVIRGKRIPKPAFCHDQGIWGVYGSWDLEDQSCF